MPLVGDHTSYLAEGRRRIELNPKLNGTLPASFVDREAFESGNERRFTRVNGDARGKRYEGRAGQYPARPREDERAELLGRDDLEEFDLEH